MTLGERKGDPTVGPCLDCMVARDLIVEAAEKFVYWGASPNAEIVLKLKAWLKSQPVSLGEETP